MTNNAIIFQNLSFTYERATQPLIQNLSVHFPKGWTGIVGANGVGKSTILKLAIRELMPHRGRVSGPEHGIYCAQRTDYMPVRLSDLISSLSGDACEIKGHLGIGDDWDKRWKTLSHGERKRAQIAEALWCRPDVLAVDEPTNHLDVEAQDFLFAALSAFQGIGLLVSHDRTLLDNLCLQCLFIEPPVAVMRPGGYTGGIQQAALEETALQKQRLQAKKAYSKLKQVAAKHRDAASQANRKRSKRGITRKDHDAKAKIDLARVTGKDGTHGKRLNQLEGRLKQAKEKQDNIKVQKKYTLGIWIPGAQSKRNTLFNIPSGSLSLGDSRFLHYPDLTMKPDDRIAITGSNGSGKSTLISHIVASLNLAEHQVVYLPQEIEMDASLDIMERARHLPNETLGQMMTVVSRLGSKPHRLLESTTPSPGEIRKILLATGIAHVPHLIIMDEPTNHLDLPSIECLEQALMDCPCGLLMVSHDQRFLETLIRKRWHISKAENGMDYELHEM